MSDEVLGEGKWLRLVRRGRWEFVQRCTGPRVVTIVALVGTRLVLVEQYRAAVDRQVIELPAGLVGDEGPEADEDAARRELVEETGYEPNRLTRLVEGPASAGLTDETITFFLAHDLVKVTDGGGVEGENIVVHEVELDQVEAWLAQQVRDDKLVDLKVYAGLWYSNSSRRE